MTPWHVRYARMLVYITGFAAMAAVAVVAAMDDAGARLVTARQLLGLWALALVLSAMLIGPLLAVLPWIPLRASLVQARRAVGILAACFAVAHVTCALWSILKRDWRELYRPGTLWVVGLVLGVIALTDLVVLAWTSRDAAIMSMGGRKWKRLHATAYAALFVILLHAIFVGADFGVNRAADVKGEGDMGCLVGFACLTAAWAGLFLLRRAGKKWTPAFLARASLNK